MSSSKLLWPVFIALMLTGCGGNDESWHGKDISGLMPELQFQLQGTDGNTVTPADSRGNIRLVYFGFTSCPEQYQDDVTTLFVSVDPRRDTPERLASYVNFFGDRIVGLTAEEPALRQLAKRYRTTFGYDEPDASGNYNVSHSSAVYVFDHSGNARLLLRPGLSPEQISEDLARLARESKS